MPLTNITASTLSSFVTVPILENTPVIVTCSPGSTWSGLKLIPRPSDKGARSVARCDTSVSPIKMSRVPSPSMSAIAGAAHALCGSARGLDQAFEMSADAPLSPSKAHSRLPNATIISGVESPSKSIHIGGETAISSLSLPAPLCISLDHSLRGVSNEMSWQPTIPLRLKLKEDSEYHVTQHNLSCMLSASVSTTNG